MGFQPLITVADFLSSLLVNPCGDDMDMVVLGVAVVNHDERLFSVAHFLHEFFGDFGEFLFAMSLIFRRNHGVKLGFLYLLIF